MKHRTRFLLAALAVILSSCSAINTQDSTQAQVAEQPTGLLTPYHTVTPSPNLPTATFEVTIPVTPTPSPTPVIYTVKGDDTMLGIAIRYGISLQDLQAANPTIDPHFMGEGLKLVIPLKQDTTQESIATSTILPVTASAPACYRTGDGGAWCIVSIQNEQETRLENLSVWIGLYDDQGMNITGQDTSAPLNILYPGDTMPLMAFFAPPLPDKFQARSRVTGAFEVQPGDSRYIEATSTVDSTEFSSGRMEAVVRGEVTLMESAPKLSQLWVLAVAYNAKGEIVGVRKWKSDGETSFEIPVYSLGGAIDHVETLVEARP